MDAIDFRTVITLGGIVASVAMSYGLLRGRIISIEDKISEIKGRLESLDKENAKQWQRLDTVSETLAGVTMNVSRHEAMLDPKQLQEFHKATANTEARIVILEAYVNDLRTAGL